MLAASAALVSCLGVTLAPNDGGVASGPVGGLLPCDVDAVIGEHCRTCHGATPAYGAPMSLVSWGDLQAASSSTPSKKLFELVGKRIHDDVKPMPQAPNPRLGEADTATLDRWIAANAPAGDGTCGGDAANGTDASTTTNPLSCAPDVHMSPAAPFAMPDNASDLYQCYGFDVPVASKRHLVGIAPRIDNTKIIHHLVLFEADKSVSGTPGGCDLAAMANWRLVYGWAPGASAFEFPKEAGFPMEGSAHFVVQIHYNNVKHLAAQTDASGFDFCTTEQLRANDADAMVFGSEDFTIPARGALDLTCNYALPAGTPALHVFSTFPHMHQIGKSITTVALPGGSGAPVDLGARPAWDFTNQIYLPTKATLNAGDVVRTRCTWANPTDTDVTFGPYTENEMCFSYTMYYPRIPSWNWMAPVDHGTCAPTAH